MHETLGCQIKNVSASLQNQFGGLDIFAKFLIANNRVTLMFSLTLLNFIWFMNSEKQVTRKKFLRWSGLAFVGSFIVSVRVKTRRDTAACAEMSSASDLRAMSRIRPAQGTIEYRSV